MTTNKSKIQRCPYCGSTEGYYVKQQAHGPITYKFNFDGSEAENGDMYDDLRITGGKIAYCLNCDKRLFNMNDK